MKAKLQRHQGEGSSGAMHGVMRVELPVNE
jgi:hypothetical protein